MHKHFLQTKQETEEADYMIICRGDKADFIVDQLGDLNRNNGYHLDWKVFNHEASQLQIGKLLTCQGRAKYMQKVP